GSAVVQDPGFSLGSTHAFTWLTPELNQELSAVRARRWVCRRAAARAQYEAAKHQTPDTRHQFHRFISTVTLAVPPSVTSTVASTSLNRFCFCQVCSLYFPAGTPLISNLSLSASTTA